MNADDTGILKATQGKLLSHNMFAYCLNNRVMNSDPSGYGTVGAIIGGILGFGLGAYVGYYVGEAIFKIYKAGGAFASKINEAIAPGIAKLIGG